MSDATPSSADSPPQRTTGGNFRWEPPTAEELQALMPGYTIEKLLGRGGMGAVYRGVQTNLDRTVAIKILPPGVEKEDPSFAERFKSEAKLMAKLNHPAVVAVYDFGTTLGGQLYFAMEYVDGSDVAQMIRSQGKLPPDHALAITAHVCDALSAAHELGIVHRDIKPANVLLNMKGQVKVADFGLAKVEEPGTHGLTKTGYAMGTPDFVAPEVLMLGTHIDGRADLYAVGVMLYQMLTGEVPRGAFKPASVRLPGLDRRYDPIIMKAMQSDREERYQSSAELRRDLDVILTVPLVKEDVPATAAIPATKVAQVPAQRSAAQKPPPQSRPGVATARSAAGGSAPDGRAKATPVLQPKSKTPLLFGLGATAAIGIGAFVMLGGGEKAKQSGPLSPLSGTNAPGTAETSKPKQPKTIAAGPTTASTTKSGNPPPSTTPAQTVSSPKAVSKWQRVERTEARWKELGREVKDGWVSFLTYPSESQKSWMISSDIKGKVSRDMAVRIRFRREEVGHVSLNCRYDTAMPRPEAIFWSDGRFQLRNQNTPPGPTVDLKEVKLATKPAIGEEGTLELAVIGQRVIARLNSSTVLEREVPGMSPVGPCELRGLGHWIRDVEYLNLDGVADPLKELGWNVPATSPAAVTSAPSASKLNVPIPAWLQKARVEGGRLAFITTGDASERLDLGGAAKFDDFVEVFSMGLGWLAWRSNGEVWGRAWDSTGQSLEIGPLSIRNVMRAHNPVLVDATGKVFWFGGRSQIDESDLPSGGFRAFRNSTGISAQKDDYTLKLLLDANNTVLLTKSKTADAKPPPGDFFDGATVYASMLQCLLVSDGTGPLRTWNAVKSAPINLKHIAPSEIVDMDASSYTALLLRANGEVVNLHQDGHINSPTSSAPPPSDLGPAIRVRAGSLYTAQKQDGTWAAWQLSTSSESSIKLAEEIGRIGPAIDLDTGYLPQTPNRDLRVNFALYIAPKSPPATSPSTAAPTPPPAAPAPNAWLQEARKRGGKLRFFTSGKTQPVIEKGETEKFDDFVEVCVTHNGWFARRASGETHAVGWQGTTWPDGKAFPPFSSVAMVRGPSPKLREAGDATFRILEQGQLKVVGSENSPDIQFGASMEGHVVFLGRDGTVLREVSTQTGVKKPPADFFQNYSRLSTTKDHYVVARAGLPPQSWNIRLGTLAQYPAAISGVVDLDSSRDHVISLTSDGKVHVTSGDGNALPPQSSELNPPPDLPPAIAVRAGSFMSAAQMTDGTWVGWGRSSELIEQIKKLGAVVDLDLHFATKGFMLWVEATSSPQAADNKQITPAPAVANPPAAPTPSAPVSPSPSPSPSSLDQRLTAIDASFQAAVERDANTAFKASIAALDKLYLTALERALAAASSGGKLEEALALREEKQRIEKGQGVPSEVDESTQAPGKVPDTLKTLRKTYRSTTAQHEATKTKAMQPLYDKYDQALAAVQTELTQAQKLDDAMRVKTVREQIAATRGGGLQPPSSPQPQGTPANPAPTPAVGNTPLLGTATKDNPFTNSLGMKFVPVPGTDILMCIHETRVQDYAAYANASAGVDDSWKNQNYDGIPCARESNHPVVGVSLEDAQKFSTWLSQKEGRAYRPPTDQEWSFATGLGRLEKRPAGITPEKLHQKEQTIFPWEGNFPPKTKDKAGNYADDTWRVQFPTQPWIKDYSDGFITTAPVMSFTPNKLGLFDMGGNVNEWCVDWWNEEQNTIVARGASFLSYVSSRMLASDRAPFRPSERKAAIGFRVVLDLKTTTAKPATPTPAPPPVAPAPAPATAAKSDFTNSLGMQFVKISGTKTLFCIHETRYKDYAAYAAAAPNVNVRWKRQTLKGVAPKDRTDDHPVVIVSWEDAQAFCAWLSQKEGKRYRLPTDEEWSYAVGIGRDEKRKKGDTPGTLASVPNEYPWGTKWPPSKGCENYGDESYKAALGEQRYLTGYDDGYPTTAPVMSFKPNRYGLYDMGGNVSEWCEDWLDNTQTSRVLRGSSWKGGGYDFTLLSSARGQAGITVREDQYGFRIVLETNE